MSANRAEFDKLQSRARLAAEKYSQFRAELRAQYGQYFSRLPQGKQDRMDRLSAAEDKTRDAFFAWLDVHSPRNWHSLAPLHWIVTELTFDDAVTSGPMAVVPPCSYGACPADMRRFAAAVA